MRRLIGNTDSHYALHHLIPFSPRHDDRRHDMTASPRFRLLATPLFSIAASLAATATSFDAAAQQRSLISPVRLTVGCPYFSNTSEERNTGFLDDNATYAIAQIPLSLPDGASIRIEGLSPEVRYWSLQS